MHVPPEAYPIAELIATHLPHLRPAQQSGLALWVLGTVLAGSVHQDQVLAQLEPVVAPGDAHALRQRLKEWGRDGAEKAAPCRTELDVPACFGPLLGWILSWWQAPDLALAVDLTTQRDRVEVIMVSVLYRGTALPVAWHVQPTNTPGERMEPLLELLAQLAPAIPPTFRVLVLADRGLWSPRLWAEIRRHGWHPLLRIRQTAHFQPHGQPSQPVTAFRQPDHAWVGAGIAFKTAGARLAATLIAIPDPAVPDPSGPDPSGPDPSGPDPWFLLTDLDPAAVGVGWYGLRMWIEAGFRTLKRGGWGWEQTRRTTPVRIARHLLVGAVATLLTVAVGTRVEDATAQGLVPAQVRVARPPVPRPRPRRRSVFRQGLVVLQRRLVRAAPFWNHLWLWPEPWPAPPSDLTLIIATEPLPT